MWWRGQPHGVLTSTMKDGTAHLIGFSYTYKF